MARIDWDNIIEEILIFVRNNATDTQTRVTEETDDQDGTGSKKVFTLTRDAIQNIKSILVGSNGASAQDFGTDYTVVYGATSTVVTLTTAPGNGINVAFTYDYGSPTWIYPDWPESNLSLASYPRISVDYVNVVTTPDGLNVEGDFNDVMFAVTIFAKDEQQLRSLVNELRDAFAGAKKSFYYISIAGNSYVQPAGIGPIIKTTDRKEQIVQCTLTFRVPSLYESNT